MLEKFCEDQVKCKEDNEDTWTCAAHLADGHAFQCPRKSAEEAQKSKDEGVDIDYRPFTAMKKSNTEIIAERLGWTEIYNNTFPPKNHMVGKAPGETEFRTLPPFETDLNVVMDAVREILKDDLIHIDFYFNGPKVVAWIHALSFIPGNRDTKTWGEGKDPAEAVSAALAKFIEENPT
ncbi:hypothetical protein KAR91_26200 [Candidatus Pacearchaeota archaeon]|nr:hypothetical protein [Candidatus Pacearchaeota archaeon]